MAEKLCDFCLQPIPASPSDHFPHCENAWKCSNCGLVLNLTLKDAHSQQCPSISCNFCHKPLPPSLLPTHLPTCLAAFQCTTCNEFISTSKKYIHEGQCRRMISIQCEICKRMIEHVSTAYLDYDDHVFSHQIQGQEKPGNGKIPWGRSAEKMKKCEFCEKVVLVSRLEMHLEECSERRVCERCGRHIAGRLLASHSAVCSPPSIPMDSTPSAIRTPPQQQEEEKRAIEIPTLTCDNCKQIVDARIFDDHMLGHAMQQKAARNAQKQYLERMKREVERSKQRFDEVQNRRMIARHANDDTYFSPENYEVRLR